MRCDSQKSGRKIANSNAFERIEVPAMIQRTEGGFRSAGMEPEGDLRLDGGRSGMRRSGGNEQRELGRWTERVWGAIPRSFHSGYSRMSARRKENGKLHFSLRLANVRPASTLTPPPPSSNAPHYQATLSEGRGGARKQGKSGELTQITRSVSAARTRRGEGSLHPCDSPRAS